MLARQPLPRSDVFARAVGDDRPWVARLAAWAYDAARLLSSTRRWTCVCATDQS
ncbi:MAG: hypothetical protein ACFBRM_13870 [Pikeienuella sp.]